MNFKWLAVLQPRRRDGGALLHGVVRPVAVSSGPREDLNGDEVVFDTAARVLHEGEDGVVEDEDCTDGSASVALKEGAICD